MKAANESDVTSGNIPRRMRPMALSSVSFTAIPTATLPPAPRPRFSAFLPPRYFSSACTISALTAWTHEPFGSPKRYQALHARVLSRESFGELLQRSRVVLNLKHTEALHGVVTGVKWMAQSPFIHSSIHPFVHDSMILTDAGDSPT